MAHGVARGRDEHLTDEVGPSHLGAGGQMVIAVHNDVGPVDGDERGGERRRQRQRRVVPVEDQRGIDPAGGDHFDELFGLLFDVRHRQLGGGGPQRRQRRHEEAADAGGEPRRR
jgi:hypothetical protein